MIVPDVNLTVYAYNDAAPFHARARSWWEVLMSGKHVVGIPWVVTLGFVRLMSHRAVLKEPMPVSECVERVGEWFACEQVVPLDPGPRHWAIISDLLRRV